MQIEIEIEKELKKIIEKLNIPEDRKILNGCDRITNIRWMINNIGIKNSIHPDFDRAMSCLKFIIRKEYGRKN